jgi:hypothetical protein
MSKRQCARQAVQVEPHFANCQRVLRSNRKGELGDAVDLLSNILILGYRQPSVGLSLVLRYSDVGDQILSIGSRQKHILKNFFHRSLRWS